PSYTAESTTGIIDLNFINTTKDQNLICSGVTNLYRIEIDKGDITKVLNITASSAANFNLWGPSNYNHDVTIDQLNDNPLLPVNQQNLNALGLYRGTVFIGANVSIPKLSVGASSNYLISKSASIDVTAGILTKDEGTSVTAFGNLNNFGGTINISAFSGLILKDAAAFRSSSGTTTLNQFTTQVGVLAPAVQGQSYVQSGGDVIITGNGGDTNYKNFSLNFISNSANVSGGTLRVKGGNQTNSRGVLMLSPDDKLTFSGGTIILENDQGGIFTINIAGDVWHVNLEDTNGTISNAFSLSNNLIAAGDLTIFDGAKLTTNAFDVSIGRSFILYDGATYTTAAGNITRFYGNLNGEIDFKATARTIHGLIIKKNDPNATVKIMSGAVNAIQVNEELRIESGNLNLNTFNIIATSNIYVADSLGEETNTGKLIISGSATQTITSSEGTLFNVELNNGNGTNSIGLELTGDLKIAGTLTLTNGIFDIASNKLTIDGATGNVTGTFSKTRMIMTNGLFGDGGVEWYVNTNETILFPIGCDADTDGNIPVANEQRYTPASVTVSSFIDDGYIRFIPADGVLATSLDPSNTLSFSWRVKDREFIGLPKVVYNLTYAVEDQSPTWGTKPEPAKVVVGSRCQEVFGNMNTSTRVITFNGDIVSGSCTNTNGTGFILESGQYTAGKANSFNGPLKTFYTWRTTDALKAWGDGTGWSELPDSYSNSGSKVPGAADVAIIQSDGIHWHRVATTNNMKVAGVYFDNTDGTPNGKLPQLDILSNNTVTLNEISGEGHIRIRVDPGGVQKLPVIIADIEGVLSEPNSVFEYNATNETVTGAPTITPGSVADLLTTFNSYPNLYIGADADVNGAVIPNYPFRFTTDITSESVTIYKSGYLQINGSSNDGDIIVNGPFSLGNNVSDAILEFNGSGFDRTITINGDLNLTDNSY
ncbi:MAG TPA: hypothetical protein VFE57_07825, partial [Cyclobacteriaceae bacterium]|nr:hypothetical protein [Cyclobacteriaceae bacterium]